MSAISTNATPPSNGFDSTFKIMGHATQQDLTARLNLVSHEYFPLLKVPVAQGRVWGQDEDHRGAPMMVVNETFARKYFPNGDAIGHSIKIDGLQSEPPFHLMAPGADGWLLIVGVVADKRDDGLAKPILPEVFVPYTLSMRMWTQFLVRTEGSPLALLHSIRQKINSVDHDQQTFSNPHDLDQWIRDEPEWARGHLISWLFAAFAGLALALAAVGLYSVVSYTVAQRTNEFGIRIALGAQRGHVTGLVFRSMLLSVGGGIAAGVVLSIALSKVLAHWSSESASSRDPLLLAGVTCALALVAALACALPARRASGLDPVKAIRYE
jgi:ABC-type antimicrobial peptide transport system permease subunit